MGASRNIIDQYEQPENWLTHALASTLQNERGRLRPFLPWAGLDDVPAAKHLHIAEQQVPGARAVPEDEAQSDGLPDLCIYTDVGWAEGHGSVRGGVDRGDATAGFRESGQEINTSHRRRSL